MNTHGTPRPLETATSLGGANSPALPSGGAGFSKNTTPAVSEASYSAGFVADDARRVPGVGTCFSAAITESGPILARQEDQAGCGAAHLAGSPAWPDNMTAREFIRAMFGPQIKANPAWNGKGECPF